MSLKFCANLSFMFQEESSLLKRYALANSCGFKAVECAFPYDYPVEEVVEVQRENNLKQILINTPISKEGAGRFGFASLPNMEKEFLTGFMLAVRYAKALRCPYIHIMSGTVPSPNENNSLAYETNLKTAIQLLASENLTLLIEPINRYSVPDYYMNSYDKAVEIIHKINSDKLKLMLDIFHLQQIRGNLTRNIKDLMPLVGHIQIAQVPDRHEPNTQGEVDYHYLLNSLQEEGYRGYIGLEYKPKTSTIEGLSWINNFGYKL